MRALVVIALFLLTACDVKQTYSPTAFTVRSEVVTLNKKQGLLFSCWYSGSVLRVCSEVKECNDFCEEKRSAYAGMTTTLVAVGATESKPLPLDVTEVIRAPSGLPGEVKK